MNKVTRTSVESLLQAQNGTVLSMYMPTHRSPTPPHMTEDQTRYKNLIRKGKDEWREQHADEQFPSFFEKLEAKVNDLEFWQQTAEGLALFASEAGAEVYHLPMECEERVCVSDTYDVTPLLTILAYDQSYYILALALHDTKLFKGDMYGIEKVDIAFPTSPEEALNIDEMYTNSSTVRNQNSSSGATMSTASHGPGDSNQAGHEERLQYFRIIDGMITSSDKVDMKLPVLIAATDNDAGDYRNISRIPKLLDCFLAGNYTNTELRNLHAQAWPLIRRELGEKQEAALVETFNEQKGVQKASANLHDITEAAQTGRVDCLLAGLIRITNDSVTDSISERPIITFTDTYEKNGLPSLAQAVFNQGGSVIGIDVDEIPEHAQAVAIYRY